MSDLRKPVGDVSNKCLSMSLLPSHNIGLNSRKAGLMVFRIMYQKNYLEGYTTKESTTTHMVNPEVSCITGNIHRTTLQPILEQLEINCTPFNKIIILVIYLKLLHYLRRIIKYKSEKRDSIFL